LPGGGTTTLGGGTVISGGGTPDTGGETPFRLNITTAVLTLFADFDNDRKDC